MTEYILTRLALTGFAFVVSGVSLALLLHFLKIDDYIVKGMLRALDKTDPMTQGDGEALKGGAIVLSVIIGSYMWAVTSIIQHLWELFVLRTPS